MGTLLAGLTGIVIGAFLTNLFAKRREQAQRRHDFIEKQLQNFYSPLLGLRSEIRMLSEIRHKIRSVQREVWPELVQEARERGGIEATENLVETRRPTFDNSGDYDNRQLTEKLIPAYRQMVTTFRKNMWLAEPETQVYFKDLIEFVEIWNRSLADSLLVEVHQRLEHDEENLFPFYDHLQEKHDELRGKLARGDAYPPPPLSSPHPPTIRSAPEGSGRILNVFY